MCAQAHQETHTNMLTAALLQRAENGKQMSINNGINTTQSPCAAAAAKSLQSCPTLCDPIDGSPPGSPVPGILQARTLEWVVQNNNNNTQSSATSKHG